LRSRWEDPVRCVTREVLQRHGRGGRWHRCRGFVIGSQNWFQNKYVGRVHNAREKINRVCGGITHSRYGGTLGVIDIRLFCPVHFRVSQPHLVRGSGINRESPSPNNAIDELNQPRKYHVAIILWDLWDRKKGLVPKQHGRRAGSQQRLLDRSPFDCEAFIRETRRAHTILQLRLNEWSRCGHVSCWLSCGCGCSWWL